MSLGGLQQYLPAVIFLIVGAIVGLALIIPPIIFIIGGTTTILIIIIYSIRSNYLRKRR